MKRRDVPRFLRAVRKSREVRKAFRELLGALARAIVFGASLTFLTVWEAMLFVGAAHAFDRRVPDLGFWTIFWLLLTVGVVLSSGLRGRRKS